MKGVEKVTSSHFLCLSRKYKQYNLGMNILSMTGKSPKKGKGSGRPKKQKSYNELLDELLDKLDKEDLKTIIKIISDVEDVKKIKKDLFKEWSNKSREYERNPMSNTLLRTLLRVKKSTFYKWLGIFSTNKIDKKVKFQDEIIDSFNETNGVFGRERLASYLKKTRKISINYRTLGRIMNKLGLICKIRIPKRVKEKKNIDAKYSDIVKRDYNGIKNDVYATDVTYIPAPKDIPQNHVFLSVVIHHKLKWF
ncbi:IS3 family transposase [Mycoplasmopsis agalactiae]|uniref:IS3 family transposase n=1 Tax=Mycoplasmopsis agalactiae TaxID=2110 RepID=UPI001F297CF7|nr:IS3 family transposase [Mycoplasmopsis agalactiae]